ncbi:MAG: AraC family transcriptional regulator, partial [Pedobacter sp.]
PATLASRANLSTRHFVRLFQQEMGITPSIWIRTVRIDHARKMLEAGKRPKEVCAAVGFSDIDTFRRAFHHLVGVTPSEYSRCYER